MSADVIAVEIGPGEFVSIPLSGHASVLVTASAIGGHIAVCFCGTVRLRDTADDAAAALDAHIAEATS